VRDILLLDYAPTTRRTTSLALSKAGLNVISAETIEVGLAALQRSLPDAVLVNTDIPGMNAQAVCEVIHRANLGRMFPIFVVTPPLKHGIPDWSQAIPNCLFLEKPISTEMMVARVAEAIATEPAAAETSR